MVKPAGIMFLMKWNNNVEHYNRASTVMSSNIEIGKMPKCEQTR